MCEVVLGSGKISVLKYSSSLHSPMGRKRKRGSVTNRMLCHLIVLYSPVEGLFGFAINT